MHANLATELRAQLQPQLIPHYATYEDIAIDAVSAITPNGAVLLVG
ncbi:hypothetical protein HC891_15870 [Candidatus Gracilibacteria bacterium]|nr:hypothetical protein [Candidatus Gracilibacteria bacterium]